MQARKLTGAARVSHEARLAGVKLPLTGAALRAHELKKLVGEAGDGPMMIGDEPVLSLDENWGIGDSRLPWDGQFELGENFVPAGQPVGQPTVEDDVRAIDSMLDDEPVEEPGRWGVLLKRLERWEVRKARKEAAIVKQQRRLQQVIFSSSSDVAAAAAVLDQRLARHEAAKREYKRFMAQQANQLGLLRGDPANIPAVRERIAMTPQQLALPRRKAL